MKDDTYEVIRRERLNEVALEELIGVKNINFKYDRNTTHDCVWDEIILLDDYEKPSRRSIRGQAPRVDRRPTVERTARGDETNASLSATGLPLELLPQTHLSPKSGRPTCRPSETYPRLQKTHRTQCGRKNRRIK